MMNRDLEEMNPHATANADGHAEARNDDTMSEGRRIEPCSFGSEPGIFTEPEDQGLEFPPPDARLLELGREELQAQVDEERLVDAWYGTFPPEASGATILPSPRPVDLSAELVIGDDDRQRIAQTTEYPWRAICSLLITARSGRRFIGTGWLAGQRTVITAGHCVYLHNHGGWARQIEVIPGRNGTSNTSRPFGSQTATLLRSVNGWTRRADRSFDYGAIVLPRTHSGAPPYGQRLGFFAFITADEATLRRERYNLAGYPGDKERGTLWWHARRLERVQPNTFTYNIDTAGGQSGAPIWRRQGKERQVVGIHTNGFQSGNLATRINSRVFANLAEWKRLGE